MLGIAGPGSKESGKGQQMRAEHKREGENMNLRRVRQDELVQQLDQNPKWLGPISGDLALYEEAKRIFELQLKQRGGGGGVKAGD